PDRRHRRGGEGGTDRMCRLSLCGHQRSPDNPARQPWLDRNEPERQGETEAVGARQTDQQSPEAGTYELSSSEMIEGSRGAEEVQRLGVNGAVEEGEGICGQEPERGDSLLVIQRFTRKSVQICESKHKAHKRDERAAQDVGRLTVAEQQRDHARDQ